MASEQERGLALRNGWMDISPIQEEGWGSLPPELLEMIGSNLAEGAHLQNAAMVCKSWNASIASGLTGMEVDMHSDPGIWHAKIEKLQSLIRHLRSVVIHVNAAISDDMLFRNIALVQQLKGVAELKVHLRDGCDLPSAAAGAIGSMRGLESLSVVGCGLKGEAAARLLAGLAENAAAGGGSGSASGGLRSLTLLPAVPYGLGDTEMGLLSACSSLEVLEFRAYRLTSAGLATLSSGLPRLTRLAITSLDSDSGYELACLERLAQLAELDLALDNAPTGAASRRALCAVRPGRSLSLSFRWTDKAQGLLTEYGNRLANLTHLDVGACRVGSESLFEAVAQLTGLRELRMAVYSNADHCIPCHLSRLSALAALQRFHLEKRRAYFPEARRFGESSIAVPVTAEGLCSLASRWCRLRSLRLALSRKDYSPEALSVLSSFTGLRELGIVVERFAPAGGGAQHQQNQQHQQPMDQQGSSEQGQAFGQWDQAPAGSGGSGLGLGRLTRRAVVDLPPVLDLACLPPGLQSLELNNLLLCLSEPPEVTVAGAGSSAPEPATASSGLMPEAPPSPRVPAFSESAQMPTNATSGDEASSSAATMAPSAAPAGACSASAPAPPLPLPPVSPPLPLARLTSLDVESCVVRSPVLAQVARRCGASLRSLRLVGVVGLCDGVLAECLPALPMLRSLTVSAPGNRAVSQAGLAALSSPSPPPEAGDPRGESLPAAEAGPFVHRSPRRPPPQRPLVLRQLSWESDDLTARGPDLRALAPLTSLRHLYLSCTDKTAERALGSLSVLQAALPYCHVDLVWTSPRPGAGASS